MSHDALINIPTHVAIICDGNRTWARNRGLAVFLGHKHAVDDVIQPLVDQAIKHGVQYLTFWVFSTENWKRDQVEIDYLMNLFRNLFDEHVQKLHEKNVRVMMIGDPTKLATDIQEKAKRGVELTKNNTAITVVIAMNYGGRDEIMRAVNALLEEKLSAETSNKTKNKSKSKKQKLTPITPAEFSSYLDTKDIPDPDFIIRTSGVQRLSGFMSWQSAYAEYAFPTFTFPEFTSEKFDEMLAEFGKRKRRFGG